MDSGPSLDMLVYQLAAPFPLSAGKSVTLKCEATPPTVVVLRCIFLNLPGGRVIAESEGAVTL